MHREYYIKLLNEVLPQRSQKFFKINTHRVSFWVKKFQAIITSFLNLPVTDFFTNRNFISLQTRFFNLAPRITTPI